MAKDPVQATLEQEKTWRKSAVAYFRDLLRIQTKKSTLVPFERNDVQKVVARIKLDIKKNGRLLRLIILKARQFGISTNELMEILRECSLNPLRNAIIVAHEPKATKYLFNVLKRAWNNIPFPEWRPKKKASNATELIFEGIDSTIMVGTAGSDNVGSGTMIHRALLSELAKWPAHTAESVLISLNQTIPKLPHTEQVIESTAFGMGGKFHELYWGARYRYTVFLGIDGKPDFRCDINPDSKKENEYSSVFIPCFVFTEYRMDPEPGFRRTPYEEQICLAHGVGDDFLAWRRHTIANECLGSEEKFKQEYPLTDLEAFLASGRPVFDPIAQVEFRRKACRPAPACYKLESGNWVAAQPIDGDTDGLLQVWEEYQPSKFYVIPGDVAEGLEHGDFDSADVLDQKTGKQVAHWHGHTSPDKFGEILFALGRRYGDAWVAPERNNHGHTTITTLINLGYDNVVPELSIRPGEPPKKHYGFYTGSSKTGGKSAVTDELAAWFRVNPDLVNCKETCGEMLSFKTNADGTVGREASAGHFDDRVMSLAIGNFVRTRLGPPPRYRDVRPSGETPSPNAWT